MFFHKKSGIFSYNQSTGFPWDPFVLHGMGSETHCHERLSTSLLFARNNMFQPRKVSHIEHTISQTTYSVLAIHFAFLEGQIGNKSSLVQVMIRHLFCTMSLSEPMVIHSAKLMSGYDMIHAHLTVKFIAKHATQNIISIIPTHPTYIIANCVVISQTGVRLRESEYQTSA